MNDHVNPVFQPILKATSAYLNQRLRSYDEIKRGLELRYDGPIPREDLDAAKAEGAEYERWRKADPVAELAQRIAQQAGSLPDQIAILSDQIAKIKAAVGTKPDDDMVEIAGLYGSGTSCGPAREWRRRTRQEINQLFEKIEWLREQLFDLKHTFGDRVELSEAAE